MRITYKLLFRLSNSMLVDLANFLPVIAADDRWAEVIEGYRSGAGLVRV
jgi:hypothetical protein